MHTARFTLNLSHLTNPSCIACIKSIWNLLPIPRGDEIGMFGGRMPSPELWHSFGAMVVTLLEFVATQMDLSNKSWNISSNHYKTTHVMKKNKLKQPNLTTF
jgi:hypothetical protein